MLKRVLGNKYLLFFLIANNIKHLCMQDLDIMCKKFSTFSNYSKIVNLQKNI